MSLQTNPNLVNLLDNDDDDSIPGPVFLNPPAVAVQGIKRPAVAAVPVKKPATKKPKKPSKGFALLWVCTHGKGQSRSWRQKDLKVVGIYPSKALAEEAKQKLMEKYARAGHGDIVVGGTWEDEIDLVIRDAPLFLEE